MPFAEGTSVPVSRSREELQRILEKARVEEVGFVSGSGGRARVAFRLKGLMYELEVPAPDPVVLRKRESGRRRFRTNDQLVDEEIRRRWRALTLCVKAKLEAIEVGISTLEQEFFANIRIANGNLLVDELRPQLKQLAESGVAPRLLGDGGGR